MTKKQYRELATGGWHIIEFPFADNIESQMSAKRKADKWFAKAGEYGNIRIKTIFVNNAYAFEYRKVPTVY